MTSFLLLTLLTAAPPVWEGVNKPMLTPASVLSVDKLFDTDFGPGRGITGFTLPPRGVALAADGDNGVMRLTPTDKESVAVWLPLPKTASGRYLHLTARVKGSAEGRIRLAAVAGLRMPAAALDWARWSLPVKSDWQPLDLLEQMPGIADTLVLVVDAGGPAVLLDDVKVEQQTRLRDQREAELAGRQGNLMVNGSFEAGIAGYEAVMLHSSLAPGDPPLPASMRVFDRDASDAHCSAMLTGAGGPTVITAPAVALKPATKYTFSLAAKARARGAPRMEMSLLGADRAPLGRMETAVGPMWARAKSTFTTPPNGPTVWLPLVVCYPADTPYAAQLDAFCLREGESGDYLAETGVALGLEDTVEDEPLTGHVVDPAMPVTLTATVYSAEKLDVKLRGVIESHLGSQRRDLEPKAVKAEKGVALAVPVFEGNLAPGWYRFHVEAVQGEKVLARAELVLAALNFAGEDDSWRLGVEWTTPDSLLPGRSRQGYLAGLRRLGVTTRVLGRNPGLSWATLESDPGQVRPAAFAELVAAGQEMGFEQFVRLEPHPLPETAPEWLEQQSKALPDGRLDPPEDAWQRYVAALAQAAKGKPVGWWLAAGGAGTQEATLKALQTIDPEVKLTPVEELDWRTLDPRPCGPLETTVVSPWEGGGEIDPLAEQERLASELIRAAGEGARKLLWPNQALVPPGDGNWRHAGLTASDGGPRPLVPLWATLRRLVAREPLVGTIGNPKGVHAATWGQDKRVVALWSEQGPATLSVALGSAPKAVLATGEEVTLPQADGQLQLALTGWPLYLVDLSAADAATVQAAVGG
ncbi:MAG: hypothetical protein HYU66_03530 [Armatimonadetes bacterium]|nr:hypothetical protein [Armatimonadota bacterium]